MLERGLEQTADLWPDLRRTYPWVHQAVRILKNEAGQQHLSAEAVADPHHLVAHVRQQAVDGQDDPPLVLKGLAQGGIAGQREADQFVVAVQEVGDGAWADAQPALAQRLMDLRHEIGRASCRERV